MDDIILKKAAAIERCVKRVNEEFETAGDQFDKDFTHQDAAILNIQRACELSIVLANYLIKKNQRGLPDSSRASFDILNKHELISEKITHQLKSMVGFRNLAVHEYENLNIEILIAIINDELSVFKAFVEAVIRK